MSSTHYLRVAGGRTDEKAWARLPTQVERKRKRVTEEAGDDDVMILEAMPPAIAAMPAEAPPAQPPAAAEADNEEEFDEAEDEFKSKVSSERRAVAERGRL